MGHEESLQLPDAFDLSDEDFRKAIDEGVTEEEEGQEDQAEVLQEEEGNPEADEVDDEVGKAEESEKVEESDEETKPSFNLGDESGMFEIKHKGQVYRLTKDRLINLAQKGFDYDSKVGPHARLVDLINSDKEAQSLLDEHFRKKAGMEPKVKPYAEFGDNPDEWLKENLKENAGAVRQPPQQPRPVNPLEVVAHRLEQRDPEHFLKVTEKMPKYRQFLTVGQMERIQQDFNALCSFYDQVKKYEGIGGVEEAKTESAPKTPKPKPPFRSVSGGKAAKTIEGKNFWEMSKKEFADMKARARGY